MTVAIDHPCASADAARTLAAALAVDNPSYVEVTVEGSTLCLRVRGPSARSARATCDDLLGALAVAERAHRAARPA